MVNQCSHAAHIGHGNDIRHITRSERYILPVIILKHRIPLR
nr:MAG TPA: hypothetical protein [Caudoviricetes sp.]